MADAERTGDLDGENPVQAATGGTSALCAVGSSAENAGLDARLQIRGIVRGHFRKETVSGFLGRMEEGPRDTIVH